MVFATSRIKGATGAFTAGIFAGAGDLVASGMIEPKDGELPNEAVFVRKPFSAEVVYDRLQMLLPDGAKPEPLRRRHA